MTSQELCEITSYELSGSQVWGVAITAGAMVGLVLLTGWWAIEKIQDWWYDRQEVSEGTADVTTVDPEIVEPYVPSVDKHMQVAKELINDVEQGEPWKGRMGADDYSHKIPGHGDDEERDPGTKG